MFPVVAKSKKPIIDAFPSRATTDPDIIRRWWVCPVTGAEQPHNVGVDTTGMVVVDIDRKGGKDGLPVFEGLGGNIDTLRVATPSGGLHCYFHGPNSSLAPLGDGVDVRSNHGYVLAPGSRLPNGTYVLEADREMVALPDAVCRLLRPPGERKEATSDGTNSRLAIEQVRERLLSVDPAIEGQSGDSATYNACCIAVRDYGLDELSALEAMQDWNLSCVPPWSDEELLVKIQNASVYGRSGVGDERPDVQFGRVSISPPPPLRPKETTVSKAIAFGNALQALDIPKRPWIIPGLLMHGSITMIGAPGSAGKSVLCMALAAHIAVGKNFSGRYKHCGPPRKVVYYSAEEDLHEQSRRLLAICEAYGLDFDQVSARLCLWTVDHTVLSLAHTGVNGVPVPNEEHEKLLDAAAKDADVVILDPLADIHSLPETDNTSMLFLVRRLRFFAMMRGKALLIPHHVAKGAINREGNMESLRGATSVINAARIVVTLYPPTIEDRQKHGIRDEDRYRYARLDDAKMNLRLTAASPEWFVKEGIRLSNGDEVGVLRPHNMKESPNDVAMDMARALSAHLFVNNRASMSLAEAVDVLRSELESCKTASIEAVREKIKKVLWGGVEADGVRVEFTREQRDGGDKLLVVMT